MFEKWNGGMFVTNAYMCTEGNTKIKIFQPSASLLPHCVAAHPPSRQRLLIRPLTHICYPTTESIRELTGALQAWIKRERHRQGSHVVSEWYAQVVNRVP